MDDYNHLERAIFVFSVYLVLFHYSVTPVLILYQSGLAAATLYQSLSFWELVNASISNVNCSKVLTESFSKQLFYSHL